MQAASAAVAAIAVARGGAAAPSAAPNPILRIRVDRAEDSRTLPELKKPVFKIYANVTVRTLTQHVIKRLAKSMGHELLPGEGVQLFLASDNPQVAKRALDPMVRMDQIAEQVGEFTLKYREQAPPTAASNVVQV